MSSFETASSDIVYACDFKPSARKLALDLGAVEAFDLIELNNKTKAGFTVDVTIDFVATNQSKLPFCPVMNQCRLMTYRLKASPWRLLP